MSIWTLPGPGRFLDAIQQSILNNETPLVVFPNQFDVSGARRAIADKLSGDNWQPLSIDANELAGTRRPIDAFVDHLQLEIGLDERVDGVTVVNHRQLHRRLIFIDFRAVQDEDYLREWSKFLVQLASAVREVPAARRCAICGLVGAREAQVLPEDDASLRRYWWWGVVSRLDGEVLVARSHGTSDPVVGAAVVEVAAFDLEFVPTLLAKWDGQAESLEPLINERAADLCVGSLPAVTSLPRSTEEPPYSVMELWARGAVNRWSGMDPCVHVAVEHEAGRSQIARRIWRAQVRILFPEIEHERHGLAVWAGRQRRSFSKHWADIDIEALEAGPLFKLIREHSNLRSDAAKFDLSRWLAEGRNRLAHMEVLTQSEIQAGRGFIEAVRDTVP